MTNVFSYDKMFMFAQVFYCPLLSVKTKTCSNLHYYFCVFTTYVPTFYILSIFFLDKLY